MGFLIDSRSVLLIYGILWTSFLILAMEAFFFFFACLEVLFVEKKDYNH
jgi:hypothetical protein